MVSLFTIFNRNDPTPTARSLRNVKWDCAKVIILDMEHFLPKHINNLKRLVAWTSGSARHYSNNIDDQWPDHLWQDEWDWTPLNHNKLGFVQAKYIGDNVLEGVENGDYIDITSGSKAQTGAIIKAVKSRGIDVNFVLQTRAGETLNLSTGEITSNSSLDLTLKESIWLSSGYLASFGVKGDPANGEIWIAAKKVQESGKTRPDEKVSSALGLKRNINLETGFWLEHASAHILSTWASISEVFIGVRLIKPSFSKVAGAANFAILSKPWMKNEFDNKFMNWWKDDEKLTSKENSEARAIFYCEWVDYLRDGNISEKAKQYFIESVHSVEFDFIAKDSESMTVIIGECKDKEKVTEGEVGRIHSLSKMVFPTTGHPLMVYSGRKSKLVNGVYTIAWPDLKDPNIMMKTIQEEPAVTLEEEEIKVPKKSKEKVSPNEEQLEILKESLLLIKFDPRSYNPQFIELLRKTEFGTTTGLLSWLEKNLADKMEFTVDRKSLKTTKWISWKNNAIPEGKESTSFQGDEIKKLLEKIVELLEDIKS